MQNQRRVVIDFVSPQINNGEFFIKRVVNEIVNVDAHVLIDGHDVIAASVLYKHEKAKNWKEVRMQDVGNDEWKASFVVEKQGFSPAATALNIPKSRLSRHVAQLEERLATKLIQRTSRQFNVTESGKIFYQHASIFLFNLHHHHNSV